MGEDESYRKSKLTAILVVVLISVALVLFLLFYTLSNPSDHTKSPIPFHNGAIVHGVCKASRNASACEATLASEWKEDSGAAHVLQAINASLRVSSRHLNTSVSMVGEILAKSGGNKNRSDTANVCLEILGYAQHRVKMAADALPKARVRDARAWVSAALAYQYGCMSGLKNVNDTPLVVDTVGFFNTSLMGSTVDALAMLANYDYFGNQTGSWGLPKTERDGFYPPGLTTTKAVRGGVPMGMKANVTVCGGGGGCDYQTVQKAVDAAPANSGTRFVIYIKAGVYEETVRIAFEKKNVVFLGDGMGKTVITGSMNVGQPGVSTYNSATVGVLGDGFMASNLTIQNTAGVEAHQAVAFRSDSDLSLLEYVEFIGNQDTLYAHSLRQYYSSCRIQGNIDFIFGQSASLFKDCEILVSPQHSEPKQGESNAVTAHGRIDPAQSTGFVFHSCVINGTDSYNAIYASNPDIHKTYLGRPWKEYSRTVFLGCQLGSLISPEGWMPWNGDFALKTLYFGELGSLGPGSDTSKRVNWSSAVSSDRLDPYTIQNFIQGDQWVPLPSSYL